MKPIWIMAAAAALAVAGCTTAGMSDEAQMADAAAEPVETQTADASGASGEQASENGEVDRVCRRERITGSKFYKTVCMSTEEWKAYHQDSETTQDYVRKHRRSQTAQDSN